MYMYTLFVTSCEAVLWSLCYTYACECREY